MSTIFFVLFFHLTFHSAIGQDWFDIPFQSVDKILHDGATNKADSDKFINLKNHGQCPLVSPRYSDEMIKIHTKVLSLIHNNQYYSEKPKILKQRCDINNLWISDMRQDSNHHHNNNYYYNFNSHLPHSSLHKGTLNVGLNSAKILGNMMHRLSNELLTAVAHNKTFIYGSFIEWQFNSLQCLQYDESTNNFNFIGLNCYFQPISNCKLPTLINKQMSNSLIINNNNDDSNGNYHYYNYSYLTANFDEITQNYWTQNFAALFKGNDVNKQWNSQMYSILRSIAKKYIMRMNARTRSIVEHNIEFSFQTSNMFFDGMPQFSNQYSSDSQIKQNMKNKNENDKHKYKYKYKTRITRDIPEINQIKAKSIEENEGVYAGFTFNKTVFDIPIVRESDLKVDLPNFNPNRTFFHQKLENAVSSSVADSWHFQSMPIYYDTFVDNDDKNHNNIDENINDDNSKLTKFTEFEHLNIANMIKWLYTNNSAFYLHRNGMQYVDNVIITFNPNDVGLNNFWEKYKLKHRSHKDILKLVLNTNSIDNAFIIESMLFDIENESNGTQNNDKYKLKSVHDLFKIFWYFINAHKHIKNKNKNKNKHYTIVPSSFNKDIWRHKCMVSSIFGENKLEFGDEHMYMGWQGNKNKRKSYNNGNLKDLFDCNDEFTTLLTNLQLHTLGRFVALHKYSQWHILIEDINLWSDCGPINANDKVFIQMKSFCANCPTMKKFDPNEKWVYYPITKIVKWNLFRYDFLNKSLDTQCSHVLFDVPNSVIKCKLRQ